jgi:transposase
METTIYEMLLNLPEINVDKVELKDKTIRIFCHLKTDTGECPLCMNPTTHVNQYATQEVRDLDISGRQVYLIIRVRQFVCTKCSRYFTEPIPFVEGNKSYTKRQAKWIFELSAKQPITEVGALTNTHAKTVERIFYDHASIDALERYEGVEELGIDEFSWRKGKKDYLCVLTDLKTGRTVDILRTRQKDYLIAHLKGIRLKNGQLFCEQVRILSCDFWGPFLDIGKTIFPQATLVGDRFHWTLYLNKVLDDTRKSLRKAFPKQEAFKNIKWLLFQQADQISKEQKQQLQKAFDLSAPLEEVYQMAKTFVALFECDFSYDFAVKQVQLWLEQAQIINQKYLNEFTDFLNRHFDPILNFFKHPVSNAKTEGNNNLIRTVKRLTFNMTNFNHFKARCFALKI